MKLWWVYVLNCNGERLYTGITTDVDSRYEAHVQGRGARFTRSFPPLALVASTPCPSQRIARQLEWQIKQMPVRAKQSVIRSWQLGDAARQAATAPCSPWPPAPPA